MQRVSDGELGAYIGVYQACGDTECGCDTKERRLVLKVLYDLRDARTELATKDEALRIAGEALDDIANIPDHIIDGWQQVANLAGDALFRICGKEKE